MVVDISALGLRHIGYSIPSDLFGACVTGVWRSCGLAQTTDRRGGFFDEPLWLISLMLTRVINEAARPS